MGDFLLVLVYVYKIEVDLSLAGGDSLVLLVEEVFYA